MARYRVGRPLADVRLRDWPAGRNSVMRLMLSRLEEGLNDGLGAGIVQSEKRVYNPEIPIIIEFTVIPGLRQFQITFPIPPGLGSAGRSIFGEVTHPDRHLLFYEIQHDDTPAFIEPITIETAQNENVLIGGVGFGERRYFRARVVNTKFQVSSWTDTIVATSARGQFIIERIEDQTCRLDTDFNTWKTIFSKNYDAVDGAVSLMAQIAVGAPQTDSLGFNGGPAHVQFRWLVDEHPFGGRTVFGAMPGYTGVRDGNAPMAFGTFISPYTRPGVNTVVFKLQAKKRPGSGWRGGQGSGSFQISDPMIFTRNGRVLEVLEKF